jgi:vanillate O-demethylase monooxygenase subunit
MDRWLLEQSVLLYRRQDGTPVAMQNRCPHRSAPLSMGRKVGDSVVCGYHGLTFNDQGQCISIPSQTTIPKKCSLHYYPVVERLPHVWIWMGDPELADPGLIPPVEWTQDPEKSYVDGYFHVKTNYLHLHENVLDLSHVPFLHGTHNATEQFATLEPEVLVNGHTVVSRRSEFDRTPPPHSAASMGLDPQSVVNRHTEACFASPAIHLAQTRIENLHPKSGERQNYIFHIAHAFTPETRHSCHYFWTNGRDTSVGDTAIDEVIRARSTKVYMEDIVILEATEKIRQQEKRPGFQEISVVADKAGIQMRKLVARLAAQEHARSGTGDQP